MGTIWLTLPAGYNFRIKNYLDSSLDIFWEEVESDGKVLFGPIGSGIDVWGNSELVQLDDLRQPSSGFNTNDTLCVEVVIAIYGAVDLSSHPLTKAIESAASEVDLIRLADADLNLIKKALPAVRDSQDVNRQQDHLVKKTLSLHRARSHKTVCEAKQS